MCLQDYQIARQLVSSSNRDAGATVSIPPNPKRVALLISGSNAIGPWTVYIGTSASGVPYSVGGSSLGVPSPLLIHMRDCGALVTGPFFIDNGNGDVLGWTEIIAPNGLEALFQQR